MNNINENIEHEKKLTDGNKIIVGENKVTDSACPWGIATQHSFSTKASINANTKTPIIYSKIDNVVDMENAYKWSGSKWDMISQKGNYVFSGEHIFNNIEDELLKNSKYISDDGHKFGTIQTANNGRYIGFAPENCTPGYIYLYERIGDTFSYLGAISAFSFDNVTNAILTAFEFSPDSRYIAYVGKSIYSTSNSFLAIGYVDSSTNKWNLKEIAYFDSRQFIDVAWSPDSTQIVFTSSDGRIRLYRESSFSKFSYVCEKSFSSIGEVALYSPLWVNDTTLLTLADSEKHVRRFHIDENKITYSDGFGVAPSNRNFKSKMKYFKDDIIFVPNEVDGTHSAFRAYKIGGKMLYSQHNPPAVISISKNKKYLYDIHITSDGKTPETLFYKLRVYKIDYDGSDISFIFKCFKEVNEDDYYALASF